MSSVETSLSGSSSSALSSTPTSNNSNSNGLPPRMSRGIMIAYLFIVFASSLACFRLIPVYPHMMIVVVSTIYIGSYNSVRMHEDEGTGVSPPAEQMRTKDVYMFPLIGSGVLFSLYLIFKVFDKAYVNLVIKAYFFLFGIIVLTPKIEYFLANLLPDSAVNSLIAPTIQFKFPFYSKIFGAPLPPNPTPANGGEEKKTEETSTPPPPPAASASVVAEDADLVTATALDFLSFALAILLSIYYIYSNHWLASNVLGLAFAIQGIELLSLGSYFNGVILLTGLFFYDIFWVFGTEVMVSVAKSFDAPIKLLFPQANWESQPSMLGLGDIVIPGIFLALLLRMDYWLYNEKNTVKHVRPHPHLHLPNTIHSHSETATTSTTSTTPTSSTDSTTKTSPPSFHLTPPSTPYFTTTLIFYSVGLSVTVAIMYYFNHAQPALLYLVPACLIGSMGVGALKGEIGKVWAYSEGSEDTPNVNSDTKTDQQTAETKKTK